MMALDHFGFLFFFLFFSLPKKSREREREREFHTYKPSIPDRSIDRSIDKDPKYTFFVVGLWSSSLVVGSTKEE